MKERGLADMAKLYKCVCVCVGGGGGEWCGGGVDIPGGPYSSRPFHGDKIPVNNCGYWREGSKYPDRQTDRQTDRYTDRP